MLQVVQYQKTGELKIEEFPPPTCPRDGILVRNVFSLISAGTERTSVTNSQSSLLGRARKQPDQVRAVLDMIKKDGLFSTVKKVRSKLDSFKSLGYSTSGVVIESACDEFSPGDRVACAGAGHAVHAEIVAVPKNLAVKLPANVDFEDAAYTTLGTIAMQGFRQSEARLGETVAVIGLGLLGLITVQILKASGCRVIGLDISESQLEKGRFYGCDLALTSSFDSVESILAFTRGMGCDSVIIAASTSSNTPAELALKICRKKGRIIIVGSIGMNFPRSPFYEKELDIRMSCSYGPGRYDPRYEEQGLDYPAAYVRWTENRNMQSFVDLLASGRMDVESMTTHTFNIKDAGRAYDIITGKIQEKFLGLLLHYPERKDSGQKIILNVHQPARTDKIKIGFIGAGNFAKASLLPPLQEAGVELVGVSTETPANALTAARQFGFKFSATSSDEIINNPEINVIFCATRHDTHAYFAEQSVLKGKALFMEKPLAIDRQELEKIDTAIRQNSGRLMVGFNRRFSKAIKEMDEFFKGRTAPMAMSYRVNAGFIPHTHWISSPENGGRIIGEVCHFIDCMIFLTKSLPFKIYAEQVSGMNRDNSGHDITSISIKFGDGSIGTVHYFANGDKSVQKEYFEVFCEQSTAIMDNFKSLQLSRAGRTKRIGLDGGKGHREEVLAFINALREGTEMPINYEEIRSATVATFAAVESVRSGSPVTID